MELTFVSALTLLLLVMDPLGGIPVFVIALKSVEEGRKRMVIVRECIIAFAVLLIFLLFGQKILSTVQISQSSLGISGGIILFLIALRIIFPSKEGIFGDLPSGEPFVVPLAIPVIAGPSAIAVSILLATKEPTRLSEWILALSLATVISTAILVFGVRIIKLLGEKGIMALERVIGFILTALAVEMLLNGIRDFSKTL